ncbi:MAG: AraC family transcriptional regulator [Planctomycetota bacterium]|nr:AraC family transcriptional regulator [Planctomycetota bacterium]
MRSADLLLTDLCAKLFASREPIHTAAQIPLRGALDLKPHRHAGLLQLDLALGAEGHWLSNGKPVEARGVTAAVFYPGQAHGYALRAPRGGVLFSVKVRVAPRWVALRRRIFPPAVPKLAGTGPLEQALRRLCRLPAAAGPAGPLRAAALCEALCLWPHSAGPAAPRAPAPSDPRLETALNLLDARLSDPPGLDELAAAAHLSPRHLSRLFRETCGCTPHAHQSARRLQRAQGLLAQGALNVTEVAEALGFSSVHAFSRWFAKRAGRAPGAFRRQPGYL